MTSRKLSRKRKVGKRKKEEKSTPEGEEAWWGGGGGDGGKGGGGGGGRGLVVRVMLGVLVTLLLEWTPSHYEKKRGKRKGEKREQLGRGNGTKNRRTAYPNQSK